MDIGFTEEQELQLYIKRAKASKVGFGDAAWHRDRVKALLKGSNANA